MRARRSDRDVDDPLTDALVAVIGTQVELGAMVKRSGSASVYTGRDRRRGVEVVIKVSAGAGRDALQAEARALARLRGHPHILDPVSVGHSGSLTWVVTERAPGGPLHDHVGAPTGLVLRWAAQLADALDHAHGHGVVHGDVTPSNVFVDADHRVRLGDFGSAVLLDDAPLQDRPTGYTPAYAAPDRRRGGPVRTADDLYGFGATMVAVCGNLDGLPAVARRLLQRCLGPARRRPGAHEVVRALEI